jgi:hypothetical protein
MTTMELNAELLRELSTIATDEGLLRKAIKAIKAIKRQNNRMTDESAEEDVCNGSCCYTVEEMEQRVLGAMDDYKQGRYFSTEDMLRRTERWK